MSSNTTTTVDHITTTVDHKTIRSSGSKINYDNITSFTKFPNGIELPAPITKAMIDKINKTGQDNSSHNIGVELAPGVVVYASGGGTNRSNDSSLVSNKNHISIYHPDQEKPRPVTSVYDIKDPSKMKKEYREDYFKQYNRFHRPHIFEVLIDNQTMQPIPIPTSDDIRKAESSLANTKLASRINFG